ncbi:shikimate dehydrogenase [Rhodopirellula halodulae]|uniref:shikimate dehydrogenase n=1 Tax=Rhodopirellula halodulae TaxID=2894198 RepID=UPI001E2E738D|nr:shikimate dehydrogenase [Rhodopirellula sp. JC737]MCC9654422.1 shikimate dehydrogenase [Rhodopirellula sp. JC737]
MDDKIEPVIAVVGHPVAGNPTQFALESAFDQANLDCRVLSFDLDEQQMPIALAGMDAMGFRGAWIDANCKASIVRSLASEEESKSFACDALQRRSRQDSAKEIEVLSSPWLPIAIRQDVWGDMVAQQLALGGFHVQQVMLVGEDSTQSRRLAHSLAEVKSWPFSVPVATQVAGSQESDSESTDPELTDEGMIRERFVFVNRPEEITRTTHANIWLVLDGNAADAIQAFHESSTPPGTVLVDLSEDWSANDMSEWERCKMDVGSNCITRWDIHAACLAKVVPMWLGKEVRVDVLRDAIEEYLSV